MPGSALPRVTRLFLAGNAVAMTGNGLVIAFTLIYLHQARGIALPREPATGTCLPALACAWSWWHRSSLPSPRTRRLTLAFRRTRQSKRTCRRVS